MLCLVANAVMGALMACGGTESGPQVPTSVYGAPQRTWAQCPDELGGAGVQCTQAQVPLNWDHAEAGYTSILLRRVPALGESRGSLWVLDGGPGFAGDSFLNDVVVGLAQDAQLDLLIPSHRGSIGESALSCGAQRPESVDGGRVDVDEWPACLAELEDRWGKGLPAFTVRQAARDVAYLMERRDKASKTYVFGGSYGTLWAHRLLLDTDAHPDAVLLDSIVPIGASLERVDAHADRAVEAVLNACSEREACARRFEGDPVLLSREAMAATTRGEGCGRSLVAAADVHRVAYGLLNGPPDSWIRLVALFERLVRCDQQDEDALVGLIRQSGSETGSPAMAMASAVHYNPLLNRHLLYRELFRFDLSSDERVSFEASALAVGTDGALVAQEAAAFGGDYRQLTIPTRATSTVPTILLSGHLDPLDPPAWAETFAKTLTRGQLIQIQWAGHSTLRYLDWAEGGCGRRVFASFLAGATDLECVQSQAEVDLGRERPETQEGIDKWWAGE